MIYYNPSALTDNKTILEELHKIIKYLQQNKIYNTFYSVASYSDEQTLYDISDITTGDRTLASGDVIIFNNSYVGVIDEVFETTVQVDHAASFGGNGGSSAKITSLEVVDGSIILSYTTADGAILNANLAASYDDGSEAVIPFEYIVPVQAGNGISIDASEDDKSIIIKLDQDTTNKLSRALVTPLSAPTDHEIVGIDTNNAQIRIKVGDNLYLDPDSHTLSIGRLLDMDQIVATNIYTTQINLGSGTIDDKTLIEEVEDGSSKKLNVGVTGDILNLKGTELTFNGQAIGGGSSVELLWSGDVVAGNSVGNPATIGLANDSTYKRLIVVGYMESKYNKFHVIVEATSAEDVSGDTYTMRTQGALFCTGQYMGIINTKIRRAQNANILYLGVEQQGSYRGCYVNLGSEPLEIKSGLPWQPHFIKVFGLK